MKFKYSEEEKEINRVLKYHKEETEELLKLNDDMKTELDIQINESKKILVSLGYGNKLESVQNIEEIKEKTIISIPNWEKLSYEAMKKVGNNCKLEDIFTSFPSPFNVSKPGFRVPILITPVITGISLLIILSITSS